MGLFSQIIIRSKRVLSHILGLYIPEKSSLPYANPFIWIFDWLFLMLDLLFMDRLFSFILSIVQKREHLTSHEFELGESMFGNSIDLTVVRKNPGSSKWMSKLAYAYVLFNTINFRNKIRDDIFIHELVHIWQYQRYGSVYLFRALLAQASKAGYDYGGIEALYSGMISGKRFVNFNFEQQGDIIQNAYKQKKRIRGIDNSMYSTIYTYYINQLQD